MGAGHGGGESAWINLSDNCISTKPQQASASATAFPGWRRPPSVSIAARPCHVASADIPTAVLVHHTSGPAPLSRCPVPRTSCAGPARSSCAVTSAACRRSCGRRRSARRRRARLRTATAAAGSRGACTVRTWRPPTRGAVQGPRCSPSVRVPGNQQQAYNCACYCCPSVLLFAEPMPYSHAKELKEHSSRRVLSNMPQPADLVHLLRLPPIVPPWPPGSTLRTPTWSAATGRS